MKLTTARTSPNLPLGTIELPLWRKVYALPQADLHTHLHVIGVSGSG